MEKMALLLLQSGAGASRLARGLAGNSKLKSLAVRRVCLSDARALGVLASAIGRHPSLVALSLGQCGLTGKSSGNLVSSVIRCASRDFVCVFFNSFHNSVYVCFSVLFEFILCLFLLCFSAEFCEAFSPSPVDMGG